MKVDLERISIEKILDVLKESIKGENILRTASEIWQSDRFFDFKHFEKTATFCASQLRDAGLEVEVINVPADGKTKFGDWVMPKAWNVEDATLLMVEPYNGRVLASYLENPQSLFMHSAPTPEEGIEAEVVYVKNADRAESYENVDLEGKILLTDKRGGSVQKYLGSKGAIGVISYSYGGHGARSPPDVTFWENSCFLPDNPKNLFGFNLSPEKGKWLRDIVEKQSSRGLSVKVRAVVKTRLYDGGFKVVSALIPGSTDEEVWAIGHLYEPGANDNASGCGVMIEVAKTIKRLLDEGRLPALRRGLRFIFSLECYGTMAYLLTHKGIEHKAVAGINVDMVGGDQYKCLSVLRLCENPHVSLSFTDALAGRLMHEVLGSGVYPIRWRRSSYILDDNLIADPCFGVPTVSIIGLPDRYWHTSGDTPEILDPELLYRTVIVTAAYMLLVSFASENDVPWFLEETLSMLQHKILEVVNSFRFQVYKTFSSNANDPNLVNRLAEILSEARERLSYWEKVGSRALRSVLKIVGSTSEGFNEMIEESKSRLKGYVDESLESLRVMVDRLLEMRGLKLPVRKIELTELEKTAAKIIPRRLVIGTLTFQDLPEELRAECKWSPAYSTDLNAPLFWIDGKRSLLEIYRLSKMETGRFSLEELMEYFRFLEKAGYVKLEVAED